MKKIIKILIIFLFLSSLYGFNRYVYISYDRVFLIEVVNPNKVIFNFINLSDFVKVIEASHIFLYKKNENKICLGQVFEDNNTFLGSYLVKDWNSGGLTLWGKFNLKNSKDEIFYVYREGKFFKLEGVSESEYDYIYMLLGNLNLENKNIKMQFYKLGIPLKGSFTPEEREKRLLKIYKNCFKNGVNPPKILKIFKIKCPDFLKKYKKDLIKNGIDVSGIIDRNGELRDIKILKNLSESELDKKFKIFLINFIKLNFLFLPATLNGDVVQARVKFRVFFKG